MFDITGCHYLGASRKKTISYYTLKPAFLIAGMEQNVILLAFLLIGAIGM